MFIDPRIMIQQPANKQLTESMLVAVRVLYWPAVWFMIAVRIVWQDRAFAERERGLVPKSTVLGWTPLHQAVQDKNWKKVWLLVEEGTVDECGAEVPSKKAGGAVEPLGGSNALHLAAFQNDPTYPGMLETLQRLCLKAPSFVASQCW